MIKYVIEKRAPNTEKWDSVGYADSVENAIDYARGIVGGQSTGVRIRALDPAEDYPRTGMVELIRGTEEPHM